MANILAEISRNRQVKDYIYHYFCGEPEMMIQARKRSKEKGLKPIQVPENVGKMLYFFAKLVKPKWILEIGTLGGYSSLWLAKALGPKGRLVTVECNEKHVEVAKENFKYAGIEKKVEIQTGYALEVLQKFIYEKKGPFDVIFIDADKNNYPQYLEPCIQLSHSGTLIISDNLIPKRGDIGNPDPRDQEALEIYLYNQMIAEHPQLDSLLFPTLVEEKGRIDALGISIVK